MFIYLFYFQTKLVTIVLWLGHYSFLMTSIVFLGELIKRLDDNLKVTFSTNLLKNKGGIN